MGTIGGLAGAAIGGATAGIPGAVVGAAAGTAAGRAIGRGAAAGERAALAAARADAEHGERIAAGKVATGDLTPSEIARNLEEAEAERAGAAATTGAPGTL
ncbi:MAG: malto-oligosyltrehalose trehalohydrolase, partial [Betaproteobacteria bacterium]|nr:malto-oligosyltrehalose trehalohydrolase [Betaproteobacteria bacterium]